MKKPNFFIVGAPKCGTTSLSTWLSGHPQVYMSKIKEPNFYNEDHKLSHVNNKKEYERLFSGAKENHVAVGEASVWYLYSDVAVENIEANISEPKYIVMLRDPVAMAQSLHQQQVFCKNEHVTCFAKAWRLSPKRRKGMKVTSLCPEPEFLDYQKVCSLGEQVEELYEYVPKDRVHFVFLKELRENKEDKLSEVLDFLGISKEYNEKFKKKNPRTKRRISYLAWLGKLATEIRRGMGLKSTGIGGLLNEWNKKEENIEKKVNEEVANYYRKDIFKLEKALQVDLSRYLERERLEK